jgi:hypothetical protein
MKFSFMTSSSLDSIDDRKSKWHHFKFHKWNIYRLQKTKRIFSQDFTSLYLNYYTQLLVCIKETNYSNFILLFIKLWHQKPYILVTWYKHMAVIDCIQLNEILLFNIQVHCIKILSLYIQFNWIILFCFRKVCKFL